MGLLDMFNDPKQAGLLAAAAQMMAQSGPSTRPVSFGEVLGGGMSAYMQTNQAMRQQQLQDQEREQMRQARAQQMQMQMLELERAQRLQQKEQQIGEAARGAFRTAGQQAASLPGGPTKENAARIGEFQDGFDGDAFVNAVMQIDPVQGLALRQQFAKQAPQVDRVEVAMRDGVPVRVLTFKDGSEKVSAFDPRAEMTEMNLGGVTQWIDKNRVQSGQTFRRTQSPDSVASNAVTMRGQNMVDARARDALTVQQQTAKAPTEFQGKSAAFGLRAAEADKVITGLQGQYSPTKLNGKLAAQDLPLVGGISGVFANSMLGENEQRAEQAQRDFINAILRQESGAAIGEGEFLNARRQYFPQPGDGAAVIAQKARNRQLAIQGLQSNAGRAAMQPTAPAPSAGGIQFLGFE